MDCDRISKYLKTPSKEINMANIKSQKKRILTNAKSTQINKANKTTVKNTIKEYMLLIEAKDIPGAEAKLPMLVSELMKSTTLHGKTISRKIGNATRLLDELKQSVVK